jgi:hypothetical protein
VRGCAGPRTPGAIAVLSCAEKTSDEITTIPPELDSRPNL